jgi:hypothetical protein
MNPILGWLVSLWLQIAGIGVSGCDIGHYVIAITIVSQCVFARLSRSYSKVIVLIRFILLNVWNTLVPHRPASAAGDNPE